MLVPVETCLFHNAIAHELLWPQRLSDKRVEDLGGNTMHAHGIGRLSSHAMLRAVALWAKVYVVHRNVSM